MAMAMNGMGGVTGLVADLDLQLLSGPEGTADARLQVAPGTVDAGLLAIIADIVGGSIAIRTAWPCGISTTTITVLSVPAAPLGGELRATGRLVHRTRSSATIDVTFDSPSDPAVQGVAIIGFRIWEADGSLDPTPPGDSDDSPTGGGESVLQHHLAELADVEIDADRNEATAAVSPFVCNHVGALLGGVMAALMESAARTRLVPGDRLRSMSLTYFAQARVGPVTARAVASTPSVITVEAVDSGADRRVAHAVFHHGLDD